MEQRNFLHSSPRLTPERVVAIWNHGARPPFTRVRLTPTRRRYLLARIRDHPREVTWVEGIRRIHRSLFCAGVNGRGRVMQFDSIARWRDNIAKAAEGQFDRVQLGNRERAEADARLRRVGHCPHQIECNDYDECVERIAVKARQRSSSRR